MRILISNDDGYLSPGLETLVQAVRHLATEVLVVAPEQDKSGASNSLTLDRPLTVYTAHNGYRFVNGTPTDCVHVALTSFLADHLPDLVLSGINRGANMGDDTIYSGTVAAAVEGHLFGIPSLAFSLVSKSREHLPDAGKMVRNVVEWFWHNQAQWQSAAPILNVNIPDCAYEAMQGFAITRLGKRHKAEPVIPAKNVHGDTVYWIGPAGAAQDAGEGTDFHAIATQQVSITPLSVDLTCYQSIEHFKSNTPAK